MRMWFPAIAGLMVIGCAAAVLGGSHGSAQVPAAADGFQSEVRGQLAAPTLALGPGRIGATAADVHGPDGRTRVFPSSPNHRNIAYLDITAVDGSLSSCTGTIVGAGVILTAAHCAIGDREDSPTAK